VTVRTDHGLFRIAREHTDALGGYRAAADGDVAHAVNASSSANGEFSEQAIWIP